MTTKPVTPRVDYERDVVSNSKAGEFVTGTAANNERLDARPTVYLPDEEYGRALDAFVPTCVDVLVFRPDGKFLLGERQQEPQPDWWVIGGRMRTRERFADAAARNLKRELGLVVDPDRLSPAPVSVNSLIWDTRAQAPQEDGSHTLSLLFVYQINAEEVDMLVPNEEYASVAWFTPEDTGHMPIHPALARMVNDALGYVGY